VGERREADVSLRWLTQHNLQTRPLRCDSNLLVIVEHLAILRMEHVGIVVDDLAAAASSSSKIASLNTQTGSVDRDHLTSPGSTHSAIAHAENATRSRVAFSG
jgi:hypothetical protein